MTRDDIPTPALLLDLDRFERNVHRMAEHVARHGKQLRPHAKTHKCPEIARRQIAAGARGVACAKLGEAEVLARAGIRGLLITTEVVAPAAIRRLMRLVSEAPDTLIVVDHADNVAALGREATADGVVVDVLVDVDVGNRRTGGAPGGPALALARAVAAPRPPPPPGWRPSLACRRAPAGWWTPASRRSRRTSRSRPSPSSARGSHMPSPATSTAGSRSPTPRARRGSASGSSSFRRTAIRRSTSTTASTPSVTRRWRRCGRSPRGGGRTSAGSTDGAALAEDREELRERVQFEVCLGKVLVARGGTGNRRARHPRGLRGQEPVARVLDDQARVGRAAEPPRGLDEDGGRGLPTAAVETRDEGLEERREAERP